MEVQKGVILAVYKKTSRAARFLVLKRKKNWEGWELPKGHLEDDHESTVFQELREEAGIKEENVESVESLETTVEWTVDGEEKREYKAFLVEVEKDAYVDTSGNPHEEHEKGFFLRFTDAKDLLEYDQHIRVLEEADQKVEV
ncbi:MAG: NUDIX domain-containing protein [Candidatus Nanohaloarchaea archaeon]